MLRTLLLQTVSLAAVSADMVLLVVVDFVPLVVTVELVHSRALSRLGIALSL